jgi:phosphatidylserine/phosphatidylglycerophosphate/cardiolipin synthase-like enzyme
VTLYSAPEYFGELTARIAAARKGDSVLLGTMAFAPEDEAISRLFLALNNAAARGVSVTVLVDAYPFLIQDGYRLGPLFFHSSLKGSLPKAFRLPLAVLEELAAAGGSYTIINLPKRRFDLPLGGRSHLKYAVINDWVYIGGCNLDSADRLDMMVGQRNVAFADWLGELAKRTIQEGSVRAALSGHNQEFALSEDSRILLDAGVAGSSLIFEQALRLIDEAQEHILMTCQFFPNDVTARHLRRAIARGVRVELYYNQPQKHDFPNNILHYVVRSFEKLRLPKSLFVHEVGKDKPFLHAKLLVSEKGVMIGSHNYVTAGVNLGTAEISLFSSDRAFARACEAHWSRQMGE